MGDLDITLRHVTQAMPEAFARAVLGDGVAFRVKGWCDTQVATVERRIDRVLAVKVEGRTRWLHVEWQWQWEPDLPYRVFEYQALLAMAQRDPKNKLRPAPIESTVVLLSGPSRPWSTHGRFRLSPRGKRFAGGRFAIDAVYQCTVDELVARESLLWLAFAPLVRDASPETLPKALDAARDKARSRRELEEIVTAMTVVAQSEHTRDNIREWLMAIVDEGLIERSFPFKRGEARGEVRGEARGLAVGEARGLAVVVRQFERRLGRSLADEERERLRARLHSLGPDALGDVVLDLDAVALERWLAEDGVR